MRETTRRLGRLGFAVLVVGALAFGATQALANSPGSDDCQPCFSQFECNECCIKVLHFEGGDCWAENCLCY